MKSATLFLLGALLSIATVQTAEAAAPEVTTARVLSVSLPRFGKVSVEKRNLAKRKQTLRRRKHLYHF